ncbi:MAG: Gfo/Idh/MocA family protein [Planctomycetaceae bacterium]
MNVDDFRRHDVNRRQFLGSSARNAAGMAAAGMVGLAGAVAKAAPGERVSVGVIGVRGQGDVLAKSFAAFTDVDVAALCDVDQGLRHAAVKSVEEIQHRAPRWESDFRRLLDDRSLDAVVIATPDHWHAAMTVMACQAGKDVYVETPVSHVPAEGRVMLDAARASKRIVQSGLQQRSSAHFQSAIEFVRSGKLGNVSLAKAWTVHKRKSVGFRKDSPKPEGVDYDLWLGPSAVRPFNANRFHYNWRWFWDYGSGELGHWGVQMLDVARWGLNVDLPTRISAAGGKHHLNDDQETPDTLAVQYSFPGKTIVWEHRLWSTHGIEGRSTGAAFYGELGTLVVDRGGWKVYDVKESISADAADLPRRHEREFIESIRSRALPSADLEIGHTSSMFCHLGNIAYRLGREIRYDARSENFGSDGEANLLLATEYRKPWVASLA